MDKIEFDEIFNAFMIDLNKYLESMKVFIEEGNIDLMIKRTNSSLDKIKEIIEEHDLFHGRREDFLRLMEEEIGIGTAHHFVTMFYLAEMNID